MPLLTKIQLKDAEPGEFADAQPRTYQETLDLITHFPWSEQRDHIAISLTNPSITIEGAAGVYLKLATYYNDKFILYYLDKSNHLYTLPVSSLQDAYPVLQSFFDNTSFTPAGFKKNYTPFANNRAHFQTGLFTYTMQPVRALLSTEMLAAMFLFTPFFASVVLMFSPHRKPDSLVIISLITIIFTIPAGLIITQFINHIRRSRNKTLTISRSARLFSFGDISSPVTYDKQDIRDVLLYGSYKGSEKLKRTEIVFHDGTSINISGLIIEQPTLKLKFPHQDCQQISKGFPFIPPDPD